MSPPLRITPEVADALSARRPVLALESTVYSLQGLPEGRNAEALDRSLAAVRAEGVTPAITAVLDGELRVGLESAEHERILQCRRKTAERDLPLAVAERWPAGATTVSASLTLAHAAGIQVFATGGIGGVHRNSAELGDVSGDLEAVARYPIGIVCSGAKAFLDLAHTLERLESLGVPVLGYGCDKLPAFWSRNSDLLLPYRVDTAEQAAAIIDSLLRTGVLITVPAPEEAAVPWEKVSPAVEDALAQAEREGITAGAVTPFVLDRIAEATDGRSDEVNVELVINNARCAAAIAAALLRRESTRAGQAKISPTKSGAGGEALV